MNQRRAQRTPLVTYLEVHERETGTVLGLVGDISLSGLMFISTNSVELERQIAVSIQLPYEHFAEETLDVDITTCWIRPNLNPKLHCIGCQFLNLTDTQAELVTSIGKRLGFSEEFAVSRVSHD